VCHLFAGLTRPLKARLSHNNFNIFESLTSLYKQLIALMDEPVISKFYRFYYIKGITRRDRCAVVYRVYD
jgi:hypothetical protein